MGYKKQFPKDFPYNQYESLDLAQKNVLREKYHMKPITTVHQARKPQIANHNSHTTNNSSQTVQPDKTKKKYAPRKSVNTEFIDKFPRTTEGAVAFIRAWQKSKNAEDFIKTHGNGNLHFWGASTSRANFFRKKGIQLKVLKKQYATNGQYDYEMLKMVAAETAD